MSAVPPWRFGRRPGDRHPGDRHPGDRILLARALLLA